MSEKNKKEKLCKWGKDEIEKNLDTLKDIVNPPLFVCIKCGRVAKSKEWLHKSVPLDAK